MLSLSDLKDKFEKPLPGLPSQLKMAPASRVQELLFAQDAIAFAKQSAVLILLFPEGGELKTVLIKRSVYDGIHSGQMAFPGGKKELTDVDFEYTALREAGEEIGLQSDQVEMVGQLSDLFLPPSNFLIKVFVAYAAHQPAMHPNEAEVQSIVKVALADFTADKNRLAKDFYAGALKNQVHAPYYRVNDEEVWGATAMIISELMDVLNRPSSITFVQY